ncbi:NACHT domain-containing protein [Nostoc sp. UHCC 0252]|uniref:NACHT domain-containing protein n=1 Tax=Nostoc sp. UHCC 0252 TaxID=3110241 RepID=UPI002B1F3D47|nr:NACHT domain-containing protein [Nostoc sp. UHCC 0252]MEA5606366.1 NACHT domain-containing protein [Nostoc sp. UHCC 0252]
MEFLIAWGVANAVGFTFKPIIETLANLATDVLEDYVKTFFGVWIKDKLDLAKEISLKNAFGKAQKEFLGLVQQELEDQDIEVNEFENYLPDLETFILNAQVLEQLGKPFQKSLGVNTSEADNSTIDAGILIKAWNNLNLKTLPADFNWQQLIKRYVKKIDYILQDSDELRKLLDSQNLSRMRESLEQLTPVLPDFDFRRYKSGLLGAYSKLRLESLDTSGCNYSLDLWNIFIWQNVCEQLVESATNVSVSYILNDSEKNYKYTVILGNPGSGKSTLAQYRALEWAKIPTNSLDLQELPLLIELRNYIENRKNSQCHNFLEYFERASGVLGGTLNQKELEQWLKTQQTMVIFDGLDEVLDPGERENVVIDIINFITTYDKARVLVTSRVVGYEQQRHRFRDANFRHFMLQDLDQEQIERFINQWHKLAFADQHEGNTKRDRLLKCIESSRTFRELAGNPLLLTMMAILNRHEELPRDRATLYEHASEVLLHKWDAERKYLPDQSRLEYYDKKEMLRQIAYKMQSDANFIGNSLVISKKALETILTEYLKAKEVNEPYLQAKSLREQLTNRSFILCFLGGDTYGFVHRTFLEYFCASHFICEYEHERTISLDELKQRVFVQRWTDAAWREVIILITGKIHQKFAAELIDCLAEQNGQEHGFENLLLAAECLQNLRTRSLIRETDKTLLDKIKNLVEAQPEVTDEVRKRAVGVIKDTWKDDSETLLWLEALAQ